MRIRINFAVMKSYGTRIQGKEDVQKNGSALCGVDRDRNRNRGDVAEFFSLYTTV
jgi:hypothetical protein